MARLTATDADDDDHFGCSVAVDGDTIIVGAPGADYTHDTVYIFYRDHPTTEAWGQFKVLTPNVTYGGGDYGGAVDLSGDYLVVGAQLNDYQYDNAGGAYIYERDHDDPDDWGERQFLQSDEPEENGEFGVSVSIDGDTALVGEYKDDHSGEDNIGSVYAFHRDKDNPGDWGQVKRLRPLTAWDESDMHFGFNVAISGNTVLISAPNATVTSDSNAGAVFLFQREDSSEDATWGQAVAVLTASDSDASDQFGHWVALDDEVDDLGVIGGWQNDDIASNSGSAYVFCDLDECAEDLNDDLDVGFPDLLMLLNYWTTSPATVCSGSECDADFDGDDDVDFNDILIMFDAWGPCCECPDVPDTGVCDDYDLGTSCEGLDILLNDMENGSAAEKTNARCWLRHFINCHDNNQCQEPPGCPDDDPTGWHE